MCRVKLVIEGDSEVHLTGKVRLKQVSKALKRKKEGKMT